MPSLFIKYIIFIVYQVPKDDEKVVSARHK